MTSRPLVTPAPIPTLRIVALLGSLRRGSLNQALLCAAREASPGDVTIDLFPLADVPFYDADLDREGGPATVRELKDAIAQADGLMPPQLYPALPQVVAERRHAGKLGIGFDLPVHAVGGDRKGARRRFGQQEIRLPTSGFTDVVLEQAVRQVDVGAKGFARADDGLQDIRAMMDDEF